jgi:hypothetical protein
VAEYVTSAVPQTRNGTPFTGETIPINKGDIGALIPVGSTMRLVGLQSRPELNGLLVAVVAPFDESTTRFGVRVKNPPSSNADVQIRVKFTNLVSIRDEVTGSTPPE